VSGLRIPRRGAALAELVVAFALTAVVSALGVMLLLAAERLARRAGGDESADRALRETAAVLTAELRTALSDSVRLRDDTAADILTHVGVSVACVVSGRKVVLPPSVAADSLPFSLWRALPERGDVVTAFDSGRAGDGAGGRGGGVAGWREARIDTVVSRTDGAGCAPSSGLLSAVDSAARRAVLVLTLDRAFSNGVLPGSPVRIYRAGRYVLHRGADRTWSLAWRRCAGGPGGGCSAAQPVSGPLAAAGDSGLVFTRIEPNRLGAVVGASRRRGSPRAARSLTVTLRAGPPASP
jgi:hypothetical protein